MPHGSLLTHDHATSAAAALVPGAPLSTLQALLPGSPTTVVGATAAALVFALAPDALGAALESPLRHVRMQALTLLGAVGKLRALCPVPPAVLQQLVAGRRFVSKCLRVLGQQAEPTSRQDPMEAVAYRAEADACAVAVMQLVSMEGTQGPGSTSSTAPLADVDKDVVCALVRLVGMHAAGGGTGSASGVAAAGAAGGGPIAGVGVAAAAGGRGGAGAGPVGTATTGGPGAVGAPPAPVWDLMSPAGAARVPQGVAMYAVTTLRGLCDGPAGAVQRLLFSVGAISQLSQVLDAGDAVPEDVQSATAAVLLLCFSVEGVVGSLVRGCFRHCWSCIV